jgi:hypothetical protein
LYVAWQVGKFFDSASSVITAVATALLSVITFLLFRLGREQSETSRAQLRAYINAVPKGLSLSEDMRTLRIYLEIKNVGVTPAFETQTIWGSIVRPQGLTEPMEFAEDAAFRGARPVVYPGLAHTPSRLKALTDEELKKLIDPSSGFALYVGGKVRYLDAFKRDQEAEFCCFATAIDFIQWYATAKDKIGIADHVPFRFAEFHNTATC